MDRKMAVFYTETSKMSDLICDEPALLQMMCRFGIPLGVGEKSVAEICSRAGVHPVTFLAVANFTKYGSDAADYFVDKVSVEALVAYLKQAHNYFLDFQLPAIRRKLLEAIVCSNKNDVNEVSYLILKFYDEYMGEVRRHMQHENRNIFTYVDDLLKGVRRADFEIARFARSHVGIDKKLQELKNIIIKYYTPGDSADLLNTVLFDIFICEDDLRRHCEVEDKLFVPAVMRLEASIDSVTPVVEDTAKSADNVSEREKEIISCIVRGLTNKEIADKLNISVNTVLTHRKNISRKLNIHSVSGLTIYAIVNSIVDIAQVKVQ